MSIIVAVWLSDPATFQILNKDSTTLQTLHQKAREIYSISVGDTIQVFCWLPDADVRVKLDCAERIIALFHINSLIYLDVEQEDGEEEGDSDDNNGSSRNRLDETIRATDLSSFNKTVSCQSGTRWLDLEIGYLKNFHKYMQRKRIEKPSNDVFNKWLIKRKTSQVNLFGSRSLSAILSKYIKLNSLGEFKNL